MKPFKLFNQLEFLQTYRSIHEVKNLMGILQKNIDEKLSLFSTKFSNIIVQNFFDYSVNSAAIKGDLEYSPFALKSADLILSSGTIMVINDVPGVLKQWLATLKTDGVFIGAFFGNETLKEFKNCFFEASELLTTHHYNRFLPMISTKDAGSLMYRAGFSNPASDITREEFFAKDIWQILKILKAMGGNCVYDHSKNYPLSKTFLQKVASLYERDYSCSKGLKITIDVVCITGWAMDMSADQKIQQNRVKLIGNL